MRGTLLLTVGFLMAGFGSAAAQAPSLSERSLVRLSTSGAAPGHALASWAPGSAALDANALLALQVRDEAGSWARRGAVLGALAGGIATYLVTHHGGSTSLCDRSANQDAMGRRECVALTVAGGVAGAGLGAWIGGRFRRE